MSKNFWGVLKPPILALAPLYDVTDAAFRFVIAKYGKPDVMYTEFVSAEGLASAGRDRLMHHLQYEENQRPIVAQIFGSHPEAFYEAAQLIKKLGFDGIDINLGCPDKNIMKQGSCAALFHNPKLAQEIIAQARDGAGDLPVSLKIRIGDAKIDWQAWIQALLETGPAAIAIHLRTRKEMSKVPAHWEEMPKIMEFVNSISSDSRPIILGNGDVQTTTEAKQKTVETGCDGVMLGRAIFGNPWLFSNHTPTTQEKLTAMLEHTELFAEKFKGIKPFDIMKKHYKAYVAGWDGAKELRAQLMETKNMEEVKKIVSNYRVPSDLTDG